MKSARPGVARLAAGGGDQPHQQLVGGSNDEDGQPGRPERGQVPQPGRAAAAGPGEREAQQERHPVGDAKSLHKQNTEEYWLKV